MPTYRLVFEYQESNGAAFNEVYYTQASAVSIALQVKPSTIAARLALLHPLNTFLRVRASQVDANRVTGTRGINLPGTGDPDHRPVPVGAAAILQLAGANGSARKLWLRGFDQGDYLRNATSGKDDPSPNFLVLLKRYFAAIENDNMGIRRLVPAGSGFYTPRKIFVVDGSLKTGTSGITLDQAPGYPVPGRVVIGGADKKDLPGLNGHYSIVSVVDKIVRVPYQTPQGAVIDGGKATMRLETYDSVDVFKASACAFDHFGTRTSRNPLSHSRGARRAVRNRTSL